MVDWAGTASAAVNIVVMIIAIIVVGAMIVGGTWLYLLYKRYGQYRCIIYKRDGFGQLIETYDKGGVFVDSKTKNKRLFLKRNKVGLDPDNIPYIPSTGGSRIVYLLQTGLKNFRYIKINISDPAVNFTVGEEDVNWAVNTYERGKKMFTQSMLMQIIPFIAIGFVSIIILIIFIYFFKEFDTLADTAKALKEAAQAIAQYRSGTTVIPGGS